MGNSGISRFKHVLVPKIHGIKRKKLRKKLEAATTDQERSLITQKIRKTIPKFTPEA